MLSVPHILLALRWVPPSFAIIGSSATYMTMMALLRGASWPFPERVYRKIEERLYSAYQALVGFFFETWSGVEFCYYGDQLPDTPENVLYISNHQCTVDWVIAEVMCLKQGGRGGRTRYVLKDALKYIPMYGWQLGDRGGIFIKRQKNRDQEKLIRGLKSFSEKNIPVWLVLFPEGTRFDPRNKRALERSHEFARSLELPELKQVLTPRTTGFELALGHIRDHFEAVYDLTILYEGFTSGGRVRSPPPNLFGFHSGQCSRVHIHIRRIPIRDIPQNFEEQRSWLYDAYYRKERMIEEFLSKGHFTAPRICHPLRLHRSGPPTLFFVAVLVGAFSCHYGRLWWMGSIGFFSTIGIITMALKS